MSSAASCAQAQPAADSGQYLTFELAGQHYGVDILAVQEIKGWEKPTRLPHCPDYVQGVINLRGAVVPIIDLRARFGLGASQHGRTTVVIVVRIESARAASTAGLVVDGVCEVCSLGAEQLRAPPEFGPAIDAQFVRGLATLADRLLVLLDVPRLIAATLAEPLTPRAA